MGKGMRRPPRKARGIWDRACTLLLVSSVGCLGVVVTGWMWSFCAANLLIHYHWFGPKLSTNQEEMLLSNRGRLELLVLRISKRSPSGGPLDWDDLNPASVVKINHGSQWHITQTRGARADMTLMRSMGRRPGPYLCTWGSERDRSANLGRQVSFKGREYTIPAYVITRWQWGITVPYWMCVAVAGMCSAVGILRTVRLRAASGLGQCRRCGYDLRASPGRCPECGAAVDDPEPGYVDGRAAG